jgi:membrane-associated phospholipid phosphatase
MRHLRTLLALATALELPVQAQAQAAGPVYTSGWQDAASILAGGGLAFAATRIVPPAAPCAPCDPASLPRIDRWVLGSNSSAARAGSDVLVLGVVAGSALASVTGMDHTRARGNAAVLVNAAVWSTTASEWLKVAFHRSRPVLYTADAAAAADDPDNRKSFPSGHTTVAFATATAYAVMAERQHLPHAGRNTALLYIGATGVAALRVAGGKHFPTDVLAGAALGAGVGWLTAHLHPTAP